MEIPLGLLRDKGPSWGTASLYRAQGKSGLRLPGGSTAFRQLRYCATSTLAAAA